jgi:putative cardiolipin synthase
MRTNLRHSTVNGCRRGRAGGVLYIVLATLQLGACAMAPAGHQLPSTYVLPPPAHGMLPEYADRIEAGLGAEESAFWLLDRADFSLNVRLALVDEAVASLDIQYFIWEKDASSWLFARRVLHAADRGVRVRILLDDLTLSGHETEFAALGKHPNIEVRTFNPFSNRTTPGRVAEFMFRFGRLNHRMHNKTVLADSRFAIIGGRNIGDRYFGVYDVFVQNDLDIMAVGPVVDAVAASFDLYWNSDQAFPLEVVAPRRSENGDLAAFTQVMEATYRGEQTRLQAYTLEPTDWRDFFELLAIRFAPGAGVYAHDTPDIYNGGPTHFYGRFKEFVARAQEKVIVSSPYFIPDEELFEQLAALSRRGVRVVILTNSLASNNHIIAHTGYKRWRKRLLEAGIEVYESRSDSGAIDYYTTPPTEPGFLGLHSKAAVVDDQWSFVGSPNVDPRSMVLNTENGFFIDSFELAARVTDLIERDITPETAWRVTLNEQGDLRWTNAVETVKRQPALGFSQRVVEFFINFMPIKDQA